MAKPTYAEALERYQKLVSGVKDLQVKGKANPYTSINGNMFSFLDKSGKLCLRLSKDDQETFVAKHKTKPVEQYGSVMRGYVEIPESVAQDSALLKKYFRKCLANARTLPAKPTKKS